MRPFVIVLLGGIASGKSRVAALFAERGAVVLAADPIVHELLETAPVQARITELFGPGIVVDGAVDRAALAARVFADEAELRRLEELLHPLVRERMTAELEALEGEDDRRPVALLDIPLAAETGWLEQADLTVFVDTDETLRHERSKARGGWTPEHHRAREAKQMPVAEKRALADAIVPNNHSVTEAGDHVRRIWIERVEPRLS